MYLFLQGKGSAMIVLQTNQLTKSFGVNQVLKGVTLTVQDHHRVGLVGSNGSGKSTLLSILAGREGYDGGTLSTTRGLRIGFHTQLDDLTSERTVWQEMETCFADVFAMEAQMREMEARMGELHDVDPAEYARLSETYVKLTDRFEEADGYSWRSRLQGVLRSKWLVGSSRSSRSVRSSRSLPSFRRVRSPPEREGTDWSYCEGTKPRPVSTPCRRERQL